MLSDAQRRLMAARLRKGRGEAGGGRIARRPAGMTRLQPSLGQEQLWFLDRFAPGQSTYNVPFALRIRGPLDAAALGRALDALVVRHEALRTRFVATAEGDPLQVIDDPSPVEVQPADFSALDPAAGDVALREFAAARNAEPLDLARGPLLRIWLVRMAGADGHVLFGVVHHIVFDGWSIGVLLSELAALYAVETGGGQPPPAELPIQFADFALWEREHLQGPTLDELVEYWRTTLSGIQTLELPTDRPRPLLESFDGAVEHLEIGLDVLAGLRELSRNQHTTLFATLLTAFQVLLLRYSGQDDVVVGTLSANRSRSELAPLIGYLVNTLPLRSDLSGDPTFLELLGQVRDGTIAAYAHQELPFAKLVEALHIERDPGRTPVFQAMFTHAEAAEGTAGGDGAEFSVIDNLVHADKAKFELVALATTGADQFTVTFAYATALFDGATMRRMLGNLGTLLAGIVADPARRLSQLPVLTEDELWRELVEWNDTAADVPDLCVHQAFEQQVKQTPDAPAAEFGEETVSYAELDAQADRIARRLRRLGAQPEVLVGVSMAPSPRRLAAVLGIMKAGAGYVPLDPALPAERLSYMIEDTGMPVVVADEAGARALPAVSALVLPIDGEEWDRTTEAVEAEGAAGDPDASLQSSNTAYVIYTSGSTGRPKGVVVEHRQVVNHALKMAEQWSVGSADRVLQFASLNFDVSVMDMFTALLSGACAVIASEETRLSPPKLAALLRDGRVSFACLPPAVLSLLTSWTFPDLRVLMSAGEELPAELARAWLRPGLRLVNGYGPTEDTVIATFAEVNGETESVPIGLPVANTRAYVLDAHLNPVPVGVTGELYLAGAGVARGYLNAPELTEERFLPDPFPGPERSRDGDEAGARLYKTGDLVRRRPDGNIVFLGRADGQVKIRGLRVELGEIESALAAHPDVAQAVVVVAVIGDQASQGETELVGYVRPEPGAVVDLADLRKLLTARLPAYMIPGYLVVLEAFPLNASGKIDRSALPAVDGASPAADSFVPPTTLIEIALADMYAVLLGRERVGAEDAFFDLGGNSLRAMQLVARLHNDLDVDVNVSAIFLAPSPRQLAAILRDKHGLEDIELGEEVLAGLSDEETSALLSDSEP